MYNAKIFLCVPDLRIFKRVFFFFGVFFLLASESNLTQMAAVDVLPSKCLHFIFSEETVFQEHGAFKDFPDKQVNLLY